MYNIKVDNGYFYSKELLDKVLKKTKNKKQYGLIDTLTIVDNDLDRVYFQNEQGTEFIIRTWDVKSKGNQLKIRWTLFYYKANENGATEISNGSSLIKN